MDIHTHSSSGTSNDHQHGTLPPVSPANHLGNHLGNREEVTADHREPFSVWFQVDQFIPNDDQNLLDASPNPAVHRSTPSRRDRRRCSRQPSPEAFLDTGVQGLADLVRRLLESSDGGNESDSRKSSDGDASGSDSGKSSNGGASGSDSGKSSDGGASGSKSGKSSDGGASGSEAGKSSNESRSSDKSRNKTTSSGSGKSSDESKTTTSDENGSSDGAPTTDHSPGVPQKTSGDSPNKSKDHQDIVDRGRNRKKMPLGSPGNKHMQRTLNKSKYQFASTTRKRGVDARQRWAVGHGIFIKAPDRILDSKRGGADTRGRFDYSDDISAMRHWTQYKQFTNMLPQTSKQDHTWPLLPLPLNRAMANRIINMNMADRMKYCKKPLKASPPRDRQKPNLSARLCWETPGPRFQTHPQLQDGGSVHRPFEKPHLQATWINGVPPSQPHRDYPGAITRTLPPPPNTPRSAVHLPPPPVFPPAFTRQRMSNLQNPVITVDHDNKWYVRMRCKRVLDNGCLAKVIWAKNKKLLRTMVYVPKGYMEMMPVGTVYHCYVSIKHPKGPKLKLWINLHSLGFYNKEHDTGGGLVGGDKDARIQNHHCTTRNPDPLHPSHRRHPLSIRYQRGGARPSPADAPTRYGSRLGSSTGSWRAGRHLPSPELQTIDALTSTWS